MRWTGKLVGALLGAVAGGGPIGAVIGAALGHGFDATEEERASRDPRALQALWFDTAFAVMGFLAKADGRVSERDIEAARGVMRQFGLGEEDVRRAIEAFTRGKQPDYPVEESLARLAKLCGRRHPALQAFLEVQIRAALAGDGIDGRVRALLVGIGTRFGFATIEIAHLEALLRDRAAPGAGAGAGPGRSGRGRSLEESYEVLGIAASASDAEVKKAYRRQMSENHPDKLAARGLPDSMMDLAKQKTQRIREAYEVICAIAASAEAKPVSGAIPPALQGFFRVADAWELSEIQQCKLLRCPSGAVLRRYRAGQGPRLTPAQQKRIQIVTGIHAALAKSGMAGERGFRWIHEPRREAPFRGETPVHYMMDGGVDALVAVAHLLSGR